MPFEFKFTGLQTNAWYWSVPLTWRTGNGLKRLRFPLPERQPLFNCLTGKGKCNSIACGR